MMISSLLFFGSRASSARHESLSLATVLCSGAGHDELRIFTVRLFSFTPWPKCGAMAEYTLLAPSDVNL